MTFFSVCVFCIVVVVVVNHNLPTVLPFVSLLYSFDNLIIIIEDDLSHFRSNEKQMNRTKFYLNYDGLKKIAISYI